MTPPPIDPKLIAQIQVQLALHEAAGNTEWVEIYRRMLAALTGLRDGDVRLTE